MQKETTLIKKDTSANWEKAKNFVPKDKEVIIYTDLFPKGMKIGDGKTKVNDLPFIDTARYEVDDDTLIINTLM